MTHGVAAPSGREQNPLVGRADELDSLEQVLDELDRGPPGAIELVGEPGIGKTRLLYGARLLVPSCADTSFSRDRRPSSSTTCRSRSSWMRWTSTSRASTRTSSRRSTTTCKQSSRTSCRRCLRSQAVARWRSSTSAIAATARCARCSSISRRRGRSYSCSTTSTGPTRRRSSCSARCCAGRRRRPCSPLSRSAPARRRSVLQRRSSGRIVTAALTRVELGALTADEARELLGERVDAAGAALLYEECGGNPFYLEQLARSLERAGGGTSRSRDLTDRPRGPTSGRRLAERGARAAVGRRTPRARRSGGGGRSIRARTGGRRGRDL